MAKRKTRTVKKLEGDRVKMVQKRAKKKVKNDPKRFKMGKEGPKMVPKLSRPSSNCLKTLKPHSGRFRHTQELHIFIG